MAVTVADINKLRKSTGAGMMDCKKALVEADGDFDAAVAILRKKGAAKAARRADRDASEGLAIAKTTEDGKRGVLLSLNCETDFVAKNEDFGKMANTLVDIALNNNINTVDELHAQSFDGNGVTVGDKLSEANGTIGEKIEVAEFYTVEAETVFGYNHPGNQVATIVGLSQTGDFGDVAKDVAMQIAAMKPVAVDETQVPADVKEREMTIAREKAIEDGKPENIVDKIAEGSLKKFYKENTLVHQAFIKDGKKTVAQVLQEASSDLAVTTFKRIGLND